METQSGSKVERLAKISRILGILSIGLLIIPSLILLYAKLFLDNVDWSTGFGLVFLSALLFLGSFILGLSAWITATIALRRNREGDDDQMIKRTATLGLVLGVVSVVIVLILFASVWFFSSNNPPPDTSTPIPSTAIP